MRSKLTRVGLLTLVLMATFPALAEPPSAKPLNFREIPFGRWTNETTGTRNGNAIKTLLTTQCTPPISAVAIAELKRLASSIQPACDLRVLIDQELTLDFEQVCIIGGNQNVTHSTLQAVNDETLTLETYYSVPGYGETVSRVRSTYVGPCNPPGSP